MNKSKMQWDKSSHALRNVLREIPVWDRETENVTRDVIDYHFGAIYNSRRKLWSVYNSISDNIVCTIKRVPDKVIVRYRKNSIYSGVIAKYRYDVQTVHVPSDSLGRRVSWVRSNIRDRVRQVYGEARRQEQEAESVPEPQPRSNREIVTFIFNSDMSLLLDTRREPLTREHIRRYVTAGYRVIRITPTYVPGFNSDDLLNVMVMNTNSRNVARYFSARYPTPDLTVLDEDETLGMLSAMGGMSPDILSQIDGVLQEGAVVQEAVNYEASANIDAYRQMMARRVSRAELVQEYNAIEPTYNAAWDESLLTQLSGDRDV